MAKIDGISQRELARQLGRSAKSVNKQVARDAWPFGKAPWPESLLPELRAYFDRLPADNNTRADKPKTESSGKVGAADAPASTVPDTSEDAVRSLSSRAKLQLIVERAAKVKLERGILEGKYLVAEEVEAGRAARVLAVKTALLNLPESGVVELIRASTNDAEAKRVLLDRLMDICHEFAGKR